MLHDRDVHGMRYIGGAHGDRHACVGCATQDARPHVLRVGFATQDARPFVLRVGCATQVAGPHVLWVGCAALDARPHVLRALVFRGEMG